MTDEQKREHADAIKHALGMGYGPPMEGEEGWVPRARIARARTPEEDRRWLAKIEGKPVKIHIWAEARPAMTVEDADDEDFDTTAQAIMDELREKKERRMAEERAKAAEPKPAPPSTDPWAVVGKAEDDGEAIMRETRRFC